MDTTRGEGGWRKLLYELVIAFFKSFAELKIELVKHKWKRHNILRGNLLGLNRRKNHDLPGFQIFYYILGNSLQLYKTNKTRPTILSLSLSLSLSFSFSRFSRSSLSLSFTQAITRHWPPIKFLSKLNTPGNSPLFPVSNFEQAITRHNHLELNSKFSAFLCGFTQIPLLQITRVHSYSHFSKL